MVIVVAAHSYLNVNYAEIPIFLNSIMGLTFAMAAVAFVSISGAVFSYFLYAQSNWRSAYRRYAVRAFFILLLVHPIINLVSYFFNMVHSAEPGTAFEMLVFSFPITDTIAACILVSPVLITDLKSRTRALLITLFLAVCPFVVAFFMPAHPALLLVKESFFGTLGEPSVFWWPLLPWLGIFLAGSFVGRSLADVKSGILNLESFIRGLVKAGFALVLLSLMLTAGYKLLKLAYENSLSTNLFRALYPWQTTTLLPGYLALLAWILAGLIYRIDICGSYDRLLWFLSIGGRTSLFTFVIQFAVVESAPAALGFTGSLGFFGFLLLFFSGLTVVWFTAYSYGRARGWFTESDYAECLRAAKMRYAYQV